MSLQTWDIYFLKLAKEISRNSKCLSRKIGAVLVRDNSVISTGYNGPPRGVLHCNERNTNFYSNLDRDVVKYNDLWDNNICPRRNLGYRSGEGLHVCQADHAERNTLIQAAKNGISTNNSTLYCYCPLPCKDCMIECINAGVREIICLVGDDYDVYSRELAVEAKIKIIQYPIEKIQ
jgi:dCMP deaminase